MIGNRAGKLLHAVSRWVGPCTWEILGVIDQARIAAANAVIAAGASTRRSGAYDSKAAANVRIPNQAHTPVGAHVAARGALGGGIGSPAGAGEAVSTSVPCKGDRVASLAGTK